MIFGISPGTAPGQVCGKKAFKKQSLRSKDDSEKTGPGFGNIFISELIGEDAAKGNMTYIRKQKEPLI